MRLGIRQKLVLLSLLILVVISFGFTALQLWISAGWAEEDLQERAVAFAREIAATIGDRHEFESGALLSSQIASILAIRHNVLQLDVLAFEREGRTRVIASSPEAQRLPFTRRDGDEVHKGRTLSRLVREPTSRYWEVMSPIVLDGHVAGAVAVKFSLDRADALRTRITTWALASTAVSILIMGALMSVAITGVVTRPLRRFLEAIERIRGGDTQATVALASGDELGVLARHFNATMARVGAFSDELRRGPPTPRPSRTAGTSRCSG
jgi:methyl-accepting chemotaxis protein